MAILNLTEVAMFLGSIGLIAYVFWKSDQAELPGDAAEVPVTSEELEAYRKARKLGLPYVPPDNEDEEPDR